MFKNLPKKCLILLTLLIMVAFIITACGPTATETATTVPEGEPVTESEEETDVYGGTAVIATSVDNGSYNPIISIDDYMMAIVENLYSKLVKFDAGYNVVPDLAESWEISDDGKTYTFHLVEGVKFHDGQPCTSADVKFTFENVLAQGAVSTTFASIDSVEAPDDLTVVINLKESVAPFLHNIAYGGTAIMPKHLYDGTDWQTNEYNTKPVGTGPFKFVEYVSNDHFTMEANLEYFGGRPGLDQIIFKFIPESETAIAAFNAGEVDALGYGAAPNLGDIGLYQDNPEVKAIYMPQPSVWRVVMNVQRDILSNVQVRHALAHAIDTQKIVNGAFNGMPTVLTTGSPMAPMIEWAYTTEGISTYPYNTETSESLLDEAGYPRGADGIRFSLTAVYAEWIPGVAEWWLLVQEQLAEVGVEVELVLLDTPTMIERVYSLGDFDLTLGGGVLSDPDILRQMYYTGVNEMGYSNTEVDRLLDEASRVADLDERAALYFQVEALISEDLPSIPIFSPGTLQVWDAKFYGEFVEFFWGDLSKVLMEK